MIYIIHFSKSLDRRLPCQFYGDRVSQPRPKMLCNPTIVSCPERRCRIPAARNRFLHPLESRMQSSVKTIHQFSTEPSNTPRLNLGDHKRLNLAGMRNVRPDTQIDHWPATVNSSKRTIRNLALNEVFFVLVVLSWFQSVSVSHISGHGRRGRTLNISKRFSFETSSRSNFCLSLTALSAIFSSAG